MKRLAAILAAMMCLTSCGWFQSPQNQKERNVVLMYIACHNNNLSHYSEDQLEEYSRSMLPAHNSKEEIFLVYAHLSGHSPELCRYSQDSKGTFVKDFIKAYPADTKSAGAEAISQVLEDVSSLYPAEHFSLVLSSHASNFLPVGYKSEVSSWDMFSASVQSFGPDDKVETDLADLRKVLGRYHFDCLMFDCCYMGGIEVCYELKDVADYIISSPTEVMGAGMLRGGMIPLLFNSTHREESIISICKSYMSLVRDKSESYLLSGSVSAVRTAGLEELARQTEAIFSANRDKIASLNISSVQNFRGNANFGCLFDFKDFISKIASDTEQSAFSQALDNTVIYCDSTPAFLGYAIQCCCGLSSYIPQTKRPQLNAYYTSLSWNKAVKLIR
ncbi:MAG: hypothetical protein KBT00_00420 [Bacteroidales bacterium]|nr:hypothetical protein [Candidatus Cacconaster merdequi]